MRDSPDFPPDFEVEGVDDGLTISSLDGESTPHRGSALTVRLAAGVRRMRGVWRMAGVVALVTLASLVMVTLGPHLPRLPAQRVHVPYVALKVGEDAARCLSGMSWSHDGKAIAAVRSPACSSPYLGGAPPQPNLFLFNSENGNLLSTYTLDADVIQALSKNGLNAAAASTYSINYFETDWSADGQSIAVPFDIYGDQTSYIGVVVVSLRNGTPTHVARTFLSTFPDTGESNPGALISILRLDVQSGAMSVVSLAPALSYHWLPTDVLVADQPVSVNGKPTAPGPPTPPGNPLGDKSFSMWRTGTVSLVNASACTGDSSTQPQNIPYAALWLNATAWSPDERYLLSTSTQVRLPAEPASGPTPPPGAASPCNSGPAADLVPLAPMHDAGLRAALKSLTLDPKGDDYMALAWSPDGQQLAVGASSYSQASGSVMVFDCVTGEMLATYKGSDFVGNAAGSSFDVAANPVWSPDGSRLLFTITGPSAKLVIVQPQSLSDFSGL